MNELKKFLSQLIFIAVIFAAGAFLWSLFLPKIWQVTGKVVVVPSGSSATAGPNLFVEAGNTAEMINSASFRKNILGDNAKYLADARQAQASSTVAVRFEGSEENLQTIEDMIVKLPQNIATYTRDIYGGAPFKYLIASDPEVSAQPVRPDMIRNVLWGFGAGALAYFLYWLYFAAFFETRNREERQIYFPAAAASALRDSFVMSPDLRPVSEEETIVEKKEVMEPVPMKEEERFAEMFPPEKIREKKEAPQVSTPVMKTAAAPPNLPIAESSQSTVVFSQGEESAEPTDAEVKDRLNRLMRGEL